MAPAHQPVHCAAFLPIADLNASSTPTRRKRRANTPVRFHVLSTIQTTTTSGALCRGADHNNGDSPRTAVPERWPHSRVTPADQNGAAARGRCPWAPSQPRRTPCCAAATCTSPSGRSPPGPADTGETVPRAACVEQSLASSVTAPVEHPAGQATGDTVTPMRRLVAVLAMSVVVLSEAGHPDRRPRRSSRITFASPPDATRCDGSDPAKVCVVPPAQLLGSGPGSPPPMRSRSRSRYSTHPAR